MSVPIYACVHACAYACLFKSLWNFTKRTKRLEFVYLSNEFLGRKYRFLRRLKLKKYLWNHWHMTSRSQHVLERFWSDRPYSFCFFFLLSKCKVVKFHYLSLLQYFTTYHYYSTSLLITTTVMKFHYFTFR